MRTSTNVLSFDPLIDKIRYFIDFELMASKGKRPLHLWFQSLKLLSSDSSLWVFVDKFKKSEYPTPNMASIIKATSTVGTKAPKPSSSSANDVRSRVEHLSKVQDDRTIEEKALHKSGRGKEDKEKVKSPGAP